MEFLDIKSRIALKYKVSLKLGKLATTFYDNEGLIDVDKKARYLTLSKKINDCHKYIEMAICKNDNISYLHKTMCCDFKFCPICAKKRYLKYLALLYPIFENLVKAGKYVCMLNLTIKNTKSLEEGRKKLFDAWRIMTHDDKLSARLFGFHILGGLKAYETTFNEEEKTWHPHFHILIVKEKFSKDFELIKTLWEQACQKVFDTTEKVGSVYIVGIKDKNKRNTSYMKDKESILNAITECLKYITKFCVKDKAGNPKTIFEIYEDNQLIELIDSVKGVRALSTFGCLYGYQKQLNEIKADDDEEKLKKHVCKHCGCTEFYYETEIISKIDKLETFD